MRRGVFEDDAQELASGFRVGMGLLDEGFNVALDGGERSAEFVADVGDEVAAGFLGGFDAGDVVEDDERAAAGQGGGIDLKDAALGKGTGPAKADFSVVQSAAHAGQDFRVADKVDQRAAGVDLRADDALHDGIGPSHQALRGDGDDAFLHGVEHGGQFLAAALDLSEASPRRSAVWLRADSMAANSSPPDCSRRALRSPSATRRAKATTRSRRRETRPAVQAATGRAMARAMRPDQKASRASRLKVGPAACLTMRSKASSMMTV